MFKYRMELNEDLLFWVNYHFNCMKNQCTKLLLVCAMRYANNNLLRMQKYNVF